MPNSAPACTATTPGADILERWQSGRMRRIRNPVYGYAVTWVRIPPSPPEAKNAPCGRFLFLAKGVAWTNPLGLRDPSMDSALRAGGYADVRLRLLPPPSTNSPGTNSDAEGGPERSKGCG